MKELAKEALIVVDVQNDFCPGGALAVKDGDQVVGRINTLIYQGKPGGLKVIHSRDWHPVNTTHFKDFGGIWPSHCVADTNGAAFHPLLRVDEKLHTIVSKGTQLNEDAYSAFDGKDANGISLEELLKGAGITRVYVCGLAQDYCVKSTVLDAVKKTFETYLIEDATKAVNIHPDDGADALAQMKDAGVKVVKTASVVNHFVVQTTMD